MSLTKFIVSIGPASRDKENLQLLAQHGMNIARFNFSHADYTKTGSILQDIQDLNAAGYQVATLLDTKGPEIRTGDVDEDILYSKDEQFSIVVDPRLADENQKILFCDYPYLIEDVAVGDSIMIDSGNLIVSVESKEDDKLVVKAANDAKIGSRRHVNLPGISLRLPAMTKKDEEDLAWGLGAGMDMVAASFIRTGEHVKTIRDYIETICDRHVPIIAKIENQEGIDNLEDIVKASDGIMIARGDLGVEVEIEDLPHYQYLIWETCKKHGKPVIYATELLKNMVYHPFPTRSEVSDVYHAVGLGHDAVMLSDETAVGKYPLESLKMLVRIATRAEEHTTRIHPDFSVSHKEGYRTAKKYSIRSAHFMADEVGAVGIVLFTKSGHFARLASAYQPNVPLFSFSPSQETVKHLSLMYGVKPFLMAEGEYESDEAFKQHEKAAISLLLSQGKVAVLDVLVIAYDGHRGGQRIAQVKIVHVGGSVDE